MSDEQQFREHLFKAEKEVREAEQLVESCKEQLAAAKEHMKNKVSAMREIIQEEANPSLFNDGGDGDTDTESEAA